MPNMVAIIQARISSTRLPQKVLFDLYGKTVLNHVVTRVLDCKLIDGVVVATTDLDVDDAIVKECKKINVDCSRGSSANVLRRYYESAQKFNAENIIRVTSDCPVISAQLLTDMVQEYIAKKPDYMSNTIQRTYPRGLDAEIFSFNTLEKAFNNATKDFEKEHVTPYIYQNPDKFDIISYKASVDNSGYRWTLDTPEDWDLIQDIYGYLYEYDNKFEYGDILKLYDEHPNLAYINKHIEQKKLES